jgi:hypothetical protein
MPKAEETYELVLIGGDSGENRLGKHKSLVRLAIQVIYWLPVLAVRTLHQMNARLVLVHRVQDQL